MKLKMKKPPTWVIVSGAVFVVLIAVAIYMFRKPAPAPAPPKPPVSPPTGQEFIAIKDNGKNGKCTGVKGVTSETELDSCMSSCRDSKTCNGYDFYGMGTSTDTLNPAIGKCTQYTDAPTSSKYVKGSYGCFARSLA